MQADDRPAEDRAGLGPRDQAARVQRRDAGAALLVLRALIGSGRAAFGVPESLLAEALEPVGDVAAVSAGVALWSSAADGPASCPGRVVAVSGFDDDPPQAVSAVTQQTMSRAR